MKKNIIIFVLLAVLIIGCAPAIEKEIPEEVETKEEKAVNQTK